MEEVSLYYKKKKLVITHVTIFLIKTIAVFIAFFIGSVILSLLIQNNQISRFIKDGFYLVPDISIRLNMSHLWLIGSFLSLIFIEIINFKSELKKLEKQIKQ